MPVLNDPIDRPGGGNAELPPVARLVLDREVALPADLLAFGASIRASATGHPSGEVIVVMGGISGNRLVCARPDANGGWWPGLVGEGHAIDPARSLILGIDFAADPAGDAAPSTRDQARVLAAALDAFAIDAADALVGASYGGMVALAFAELFPERAGRLVIISAGAEPHPAATAARELQRRVVGLGLQNGCGGEALAIARGMAMLSYRTAQEFDQRFEGGIAAQSPLAASEPGAYLRARGRDFLSVMSPQRFLSLSAAIDRHRVDPAGVRCPILLIGADSDQLVPPQQLRELAARCGGPVDLHLRPSLYGHDMFLKEAEAIGAIVGPFLAGSA